MMKPVNIYALSRITEADQVAGLERQSSKRTELLGIKKWELQGMKSLADRLSAIGHSIELLEFYYSFQLPNLGKEFDLLRISDDSIINIELKSEHISDESIKKQLLLNRYYLAVLGKRIRSYTYISADQTLVRLTSGENLKTVTLEELYEDLKKQTDLYEGDIEELFTEEQYLISPLTDSERFLRGDYFLTSQQWDIRKQILRGIANAERNFQGFTGLPGTGKTLLLYDLAKALSRKQRVCIYQYASFGDEQMLLKDRLKRIDFYCISEMGRKPVGDEYSALLVDEGQNLPGEVLALLKSYSLETGTPVIFTYDSEDTISTSEQSRNTTEDIRQLPDYKEFRLTNRIRMNKELSSFINHIMHQGGIGRYIEYPSVSLTYARNSEEEELLLAYYQKKGYIYISGDRTLQLAKEYEKVLMVIDDTFYYDEKGYLRSQKKSEDEQSRVRILFHGLNRAKKKLALVVMDNEKVFAAIVSLLQKK